MRVLLLAALLSLAAPATDTDPLAAAERAWQVLFTQTAGSVVFIKADRAFGSGFLVNAGGLVLTNAHVVGKAKHVIVVTYDGRRLRGRVTERGRDDIDLALVQTPLRGGEPLSLRGGVSDLRVGSWVASVGHGSGGIWTFNTGMISNIYPDGAEHPVFQTQIPLNPGSSGGPIIDRRGRVVGVVTAGLASSNSINFGIKIDVACRVLDGLAKPCGGLVVTAPDSVAVFVDGTMVGTGPSVFVPVSSGRHEVFGVIDGEMARASVTYPQQSLVRLARPR